jgi:hypothetical protein
MAPLGKGLQFDLKGFLSVKLCRIKENKTYMILFLGAFLSNRMRVIH